MHWYKFKTSNILYAGEQKIISCGYPLNTLEIELFHSDYVRERKVVDVRIPLALQYT